MSESMPAAASKEAAVDKTLDANRRSMLVNVLIKRVEVRSVSALCVCMDDARCPGSGILSH